MALALNRIGASALRGAYRIRPRTTQSHFKVSTRLLHQTSPLRRDDPIDPRKPNNPPQQDESGKPQESEPRADNHAATESGEASVTSPGNYAAQSRQEPASDVKDSEFEAKTIQWLEEMKKEMFFDDIKDVKERADRDGFMPFGEDETEHMVPDEPFLGDDVTPLAHGQIQQHREIREYARIAAWEMPLLSKFAKPFEPPTDSPLRFRYTNYMGETHPSEKKVVLEFCTSDLPLSPKERLKLVKLLGPRYNPQKDMAKMSCEMFQSAAQNKRYLGDMVDTLMATAKGEGDAEGAKDSFEDVPVDFRHVKWKTPPVFPEAWKMTESRQQYLNEQRERRALAEADRVDKGEVVEGAILIDVAMKSQPALATKVDQRSKKGQRQPRV